MTNELKLCEKYLPDLLLDPDHLQPEAAAHLSTCAACQQELQELRSTMALMDAWTAPEPSAFFDARLHARLREVQEAPAGLWGRVATYLHLDTGWGLRPAMTGTLALGLLLGGGTVATVLVHQHGSAASSPTVNDLKIYDNNAQTVQQMDMLDETSSAGDDTPQT